MPDFDLAVIGAGAVGASAAYAAARSGKRVVVFEQFDVGHDRGSSHGESRIIRHSYTSAAYASLAPDAFAAWRELERGSGERLLTMTGGIDIGHSEDRAMRACKEALDKSGIGSVFLESVAAREAFPQFVLGESDAVLWQSGAGILHAGRCVRALVSQAVANGADLRERTSVASLEPGPAVRVTFQRDGEEGYLTASAAVVAAGPWAGRFFADLGLANELRVTHQQVAYYPLLDPEPWRAGRCPIYIAHGPDGFYGFPECERPGFIKVAVETELAIEDPDQPPRAPDPETTERLNELVATRLRGVRSTPESVVTCRYTETVDRDFIVDRHPAHPNVVVAAPCSGHGFKFSILMGGLAQGLATSPGERDLFAHWRERFSLEKESETLQPLAREWRK